MNLTFFLYLPTNVSLLIQFSSFLSIVPPPLAQLISLQEGKSEKIYFLCNYYWMTNRRSTFSLHAQEQNPYSLWRSNKNNLRISICVFPFDPDSNNNAILWFWRLLNETMLCGEAVMLVRAHCSNSASTPALELWNIMNMLDGFILKFCFSNTRSTGNPIINSKEIQLTIENRREEQEKLLLVAVFWCSESEVGARSVMPLSVPAAKLIARLRITARHRSISCLQK